MNCAGVAGVRYLRNGPRARTGKLEAVRFATLAILAAFGPACSFGSPTGSASSTDAATDVPPDVRAGCFGSIVPVCPDTLPAATRSLDGTINTDTHPDCRPTGTSLDACVIAGSTIAVANVRATGSKPLVLLATRDISINGTLDVASRVGGPRGAGSGTGTCVAGGAATSRRGGAGGSHGGAGGDGGNGGPGSGGKGTAGPIASWMGLRGGCDGARGSGNLPGQGGAGGGAVALVAMKIVVAGTINASGAAGLESDDEDGDAGGAGGGGAGGTIVLDAPDVTITGFAFTNGGGGGGASACSSDSGNNGTDPTSTAPGAGGAGGADGMCEGGDGGTGSSGGDGSQAQDGESGGGGGGGGGGAGVIKTSDPTPPGNTSPQLR
jgi:hypothetical protein